MSYLTRMTRTCALCGKQSQFTVALSTNAFGSMDLDTRPPEMARSVLPFEIQQCPHCNYANPDIEENPLGICPSDLSASAYVRLAKNRSINSTARSYLLAGYLYEQKQKYRQAGGMYLKAAWSFDDMRNDSGAISARKKAVENIEKWLQETDEVNLEVMTVDLYRRIGDFEKADRTIGRLMKRELPELLASILNFERKLIGEKDTRCHRVEEAE